MQLILLATVLAFLAKGSAMPITPAAPELQLLADKMRSEGVSEREISERLSLSGFESEVDTMPSLSSFSSRFQSFLWKAPEKDTTGDIAPGSVESPEMLPRAAAPESLTDSITATLYSVISGNDFENRKFGYEGKESEMRRPEGMRHWG